MLFSFDGFLLLAAMLVPLMFLQRALHREIQSVFFILTRNFNSTLIIFALIFFPGVLLHELSHFLMAKILRVRTGRFSLIPKSMSDGRLQMGYVEIYRSDIIRDSLIGAAPIIAGTGFIAFAALSPLHLLPLWDVLRNGQWDLFWLGVSLLRNVPYFWLWFYLTFVVSSTMLPSESDRHAWLPLGLWAGALLALIIFAGAGAWMLENITPLLNDFTRSLATLFGLSVLVHIILLIPIFLLHRLIVILTGVDVE